MLGKISNVILNYICGEEITEEKKEILLFGITRIVEDIPKTIGIIIIAILLGIFKEVVIITGVVALYKTFLGGVHLKTNMGCFIYSVVFYLITVYSARYLSFMGNDQFGIYALIYLFALYVIIVYAPADVPEIPKVDNKLRRNLKVKSLIMLNIIYLICIFIIKDMELNTIIIYSIFYISLMATRSIYRLFKNQYGYETYVPDELI